MRNRMFRAGMHRAGQMGVRLALSISAFSIFAVTAFLAGCSHDAATGGPSAGTLALAGKVHGGQQPITGATVQLYAVGGTGTGSASTALLTQAVTTDQYGSFNITSLYTCPTASTDVYLVATGGNPGLGAGTNNTAISMMAALGTCGSLGSSTYIDANEVTTLGSMAAIYPYMTSYAAIGATHSDTTLANDFATLVTQYTNIANGTAPGPTLPAGSYAASTEIDTLANVVSTCINSAGGVAGDGSACGNLFQLTTPSGGVAPTETIGALLNILKAPTVNVAAIFNLSPAIGAPFQPSLSAAPTDWTLPIVVLPAAPVLYPTPGTYTGVQTFAIANTTTGVAYYYTTDGSTPTISSTLYNGPFSLISSETIKAISSLGSHANSAVVTGVYTILTAAATPSFSLASGTYNGSQSVTIGTTSSGASIYYTTDGSTPTASSTLYAGAVTVAATETINAIASGGGFGASNVGSASYTITNLPTAVTPVLSLAAGTYSTAQSMTITDASSGATIYYTTDGSTPTISSQVYTGAFNVYQTETVQAIASGGGYAPSGIASTSYTITAIYPVLTTEAGNGIVGFSGNGGAATSAELRSVGGTAVDSAGNLYIADTGNSVIRKVTPAGVISAFAGDTVPYYGGDGGQAASAYLNNPSAVAVDSAGNVYIADNFNYRIRKVNTSGIISTIAGTGNQGESGDGGQGTSANLEATCAITVDSVGNVYFAECGYNQSRVRRITPAGVISTVAGLGTSGYNGDNTLAFDTGLNSPSGLAVDQSGNLYIADTNNGRVRKVGTNRIITTVVGNGVLNSGGDGGPATSAGLISPKGIAFDAAGNLYIADSSSNVVRVVNTAGIISTFAGNRTAGFVGDGAPPTDAEVSAPSGLSIDPTTGNIYISDVANYRVRVVTFGAVPPQAGTPTPTLAAGTYNGAQTLALASTSPGVSIYYTTDGSTPSASSTLYSSSGSLTVSSSETINAVAIGAGYANSGVSSTSYVITSLTPTAAPGFSPAPGSYASSQSVTLSAGGATIYYTTDGSTPTTSSSVYGGAITVSSSETISAIAVASGQAPSPVASGGYYINQGAGVIATVAGNGTAGYLGDGDQATHDELYNPGQVAFDAAGNMYIADAQNQRVRKVTPAGIISTVAGSDGGASFGGDGGLAINAHLYSPGGVAVDSHGNLYIADLGNNRIRKVTPAGIISTYAGTGVFGYGGDGGVASNAALAQPWGLAMDSADNLYISDKYNNRIRKITPQQIITTVAGSATGGFSGDGGLATSAALSQPEGVAVDSAGNLYIADYYNHRIRMVNAAGIISTIAGTGTAGYSGDGAAATSATIDFPGGVGVDSTGNVYIADTNNNRIRKFVVGGTISTIAGTGSASYSGDGGVGTAAAIYQPQNVLPDASGNVYIVDTQNQRIRKISY